MSEDKIEDINQDAQPDESRDRPVTKVKRLRDSSRDRAVDRVTVPEAAVMLGVTQSAVRKRVQRGTIPWDKDDEGRIYVYVDLAETSLEAEGEESRNKPPGQSRDELLEAYRDQVEFLRRELERKDTLLMSLMQRVPELEPVAEPRQAPETPSEDTARDDVPFSEPAQVSERRSWLSKFFFGP
jgi:hypothetical protein